VPEDTFRDEDGDWTHEIALLGGTCGSRRFGAGELAALAADVRGGGGDRRRHRGAQLLSAWSAARVSASGSNFGRRLRKT